MATTTLSESYKDTPHQLSQIVPLDFDSIQDLPDSHSWPESETSIYSICDDQVDVVPIIDLRDPNIVQLMGNACREWGVFQVTNHGVPSNLVDHVEAHARRLFALPTHRKLKARRSHGGATGYGVARISHFFSKLMWHEGFTIMGSAVEHARQLWPQEYREFCVTMDNYQKQMKSLAHKILVLILRFLQVQDQDQELLLSACSPDQSEGALQLNSYPRCPNSERAIGLAPHTDSLLLTILHQSDTNGLEIFKDNSKWISVPPLSGALIINTGDLLHIISNAQFPNVYHRVVPNEASHRFSIAYFYSPRAGSIVAPLTNLASPRFRLVTVKEYLQLKNIHFEKALSMIRM